MAKRIFAEMPERDVERMAPEILAGILPRIYPQMLDEVHRHQDEGRATFIVSAAGNDLVRMLAGVLGMEGGIGTRWAVGDDGVYTGQMDGPFVYGEGKVEAMRRFAEKHDIDLDASYAYSDSASDLPMLRAVGHPVVVNPDHALAEVAKAEGWEVMRFEKLGRRIAIGAAALAAAVGGGAVASSRAMRHPLAWLGPQAARTGRALQLRTRILLTLTLSIAGVVCATGVFVLANFIVSTESVERRVVGPPRQRDHLRRLSPSLP